MTDVDVDLGETPKGQFQVRKREINISFSLLYKEFVILLTHTIHVLLVLDTQPKLYIYIEIFFHICNILNKQLHSFAFTSIFA